MRTTRSRPSKPIGRDFITYTLLEYIANGEIEQLERYKFPWRSWSQWLSLKFAWRDVSKHRNRDCAGLPFLGFNCSAASHKKTWRRTHFQCIFLDSAQVWLSRRERHQLREIQVTPSHTDKRRHFACAAKLRSKLSHNIGRACDHSS